MNKKLFFAAALPLVLASCNNELETISVEEQTNSTEIVGAKLVSEGLTINVNQGDVQSRLDASGWKNGDQVGLAWYNIKSHIYDVQVGNTFDWAGILDTDSKVYGNHKFIYNGGLFETQSNVYEGAHFAYYPYAYQKQAAQLTFEANAAVQTAGFEADLFANSLHISAQDTILATSVEEGQVAKSFDLVRMVNTLKFQLKSEELADADYMSTLPITGVKLSVFEAGEPNGHFYTTASLNPSKLPVAKYDDEEDTDEDGVVGYDAIETKAGLYGATVFGTDATAAVQLSGQTKEVTTTVNNPAYTLGNAQSDVRMFLFPTKAQATTIPAGAIAVRVYVPGGYFTIKYEASAANTTAQNQATLKELREYLSSGFTTGGKTYKASVLGNGATKDAEKNALTKGLKFDLLKKNFTADFSDIKTLPEWNGAVVIADELGYVNPTFTVTKPIEFTEGEIKTPANGVKVVTNTTGGATGKLVVKSAITWPSNLTATVESVKANVEVATNATLTVLDGKSLTDAAVTNYGTIVAGFNAELENIDNTDGRIEVVYGSFVTVDPAQKGIIAYEVAQDEAMYKINNLMKTTEGASVNTLVLNDGVNFNLSKIDGITNDNDPYVETILGGSKLSIDQAKTLDIELKGGKLQANVNSGYFVNDIKVISGSANEITNVDVEGDLTVAQNATVVVDNGVNTLGTKNSVLVFGNVENNGNLTIKTDVYCEKVVNKGTLTTNTTGNYASLWWMTDSQVQNSNVSGSVNRYYGTIVKSANEINTLKDEFILAVDAIMPITVGAGGNVAIIGNGRTVKFSKDGDGILSVATTSSKKLTIKNAKLTKAEAPTHANNNAYNFKCDVDLSYIISDAYIWLHGASNLNNVVINNTLGSYGLWILLNGQKVTIDKCKFNSTHNDGRCIKIDYSYATSPNKVELTVNNSEFISKGKKAAVLVDARQYGAKIVWGANNNISQVAADKTNAVMVDESSEANFAKVEVIGCTKVQE